MFKSSYTKAEHDIEARVKAENHTRHFTNYTRE